MSETPPVVVDPTAAPPASGEAQPAPATNDASTDESPRRRGRWTIGLALGGLALAGTAAWFMFGGDDTDAAEEPAR